MLQPDAVLLDHQLSGARWLVARSRGILGDVPGLGKTRTAIEAARLAGAQRVAILAPANALAVWDRELAAMGDPFLGVAMSSYDKYVRSATTRDIIEQFGADAIVLDEVHYLANERSQRSHEAFQLAAPHVWGLSGTPMPRHPGQLFAVANAFWPADVRRLGLRSYYGWLDRFTFWRQGDYGPRVLGPRHVAELRAFLDGKLLRRDELSAGVHLPPLRWTVGVLTADPDALLRANEIAAELTDAERATIAAGSVPSGPQARVRHLLGDLKAPIAGALIERELFHAPTHEKRVVFAYHHSVLDALEAQLRTFGVVRVDGGSSTKERKDAEERFQGDPAMRVFLGQTQAAATAMTLTAAHHADIVEPDWRTDMNVQDGKRIHRMGQRLPSWVRMLAVADTLDEAIVTQHHREVQMAERILD